MPARSWTLSAALFCLTLAAAVLLQSSSHAATLPAPGIPTSPFLPPAPGHTSSTNR